MTDSQPTAPRRPSGLLSDAVAGMPGAIASVSDGMAASVLTGINPVHGLYASFAGPIGGGALSSSRLMVITTTSAAALAAGSAVADVPSADRAAAVFLLTAIAGVLMVAAGLARLGRYVRFVPYSVMVGFLTGVAVNILFGQLGDLTGTDPPGANALSRGLHVLTHPGQIQVDSLLVGLAAIAILLLLRVTPLRQVAALFALIIPSAVTAIADLTVAIVAEDGPIPAGLPVPALPELRLLTVDLALGALAVAVLVLVQGSGVAEAAPNPDGSPSDANRDFLAQGVGNLASAVFAGQPVGGSVGQTAVNVEAGARTRWATIWSGIWMAVILVALSGVVGEVATPTLAAVLIVAATSSLKPGEVIAINRTSTVSRVALLTTLIATLLLPVAVAVGIGVAVSLLLQLNRDAQDLRVVALVPEGDDRLLEQPAPAELTSARVLVLDIYGSLLYAGSRTLQARLPAVGDARRPVVVLRLRGRVSLGSTFFTVVSDYARQLHHAGGRLYLSGVDPDLLARMERNGRVRSRYGVQVFAAEPELGRSTREAIADAELWLVHGDDAEAAHGDVQEGET